MPTDVFRAADATIVLATDDTQPGGAAATGLIAQYDMTNAVGRLTNLRISVASAVESFYEIGRRYPAALRPGRVSVRGCADRAMINGALLRLLLGDGSVSPPSGPAFVQPAFNVLATLREPARPDSFAKLTVFGAQFDSWSYDLGTDRDFVMESVTFQAMRLGYEEA
ncbi:hypothetical protein [Humibacillus xanthopallidus]|uniref:Uncharacterized protein n=1 Tax=Humibacillus xanthopallidus TaxID=412689 RepID=A0A543HU96_9MICO|nr:hypothetical protein [Humibacillus xanthopallidus]TQM61937.1 hypothetical protein FBY41_1959 [Humibacillus xanthopallidus]